MKNLLFEYMIWPKMNCFFVKWDEIIMLYTITFSCLKICFCISLHKTIIVWFDLRDNDWHNQLFASLQNRDERILSIYENKEMDKLRWILFEDFQKMDNLKWIKIWDLRKMDNYRMDKISIFWKKWIKKAYAPPP